MVTVSVSSKRYQCEFTLFQKTTVVIGESGKGKTVLVRALSDNSGAYKVSLSDKRFKIVVLTLRDYEAQLAFYRGKACIFVVDDEDFMYTESFAGYLSEDKSSYFLLICRLDAATVSGGVLGNIGFSAKEIYRFETDGIRHWLERLCTYPKTANALDSNLIDVCFVEDGTTGYEFFRRIFKNVVTTHGKTNILRTLKENMEGIRGKTLFLAVDLSGAGFYVTESVQYCKLNGVMVYLLNTYESFEYMVLLSNMFQYDKDSLDTVNLLCYSTLEQKCTDILTRITGGQPNKYSKTKESTCYYLDCCSVKRSKKCSVGLSGNKVTAMLKGTPFEIFLKLQQIQEGDEIC